MAGYTPFFGMRGTGDWVTNQRPENWRQMMLRLYPNGEMTLTGMLSMLNNSKTTDPTYHWWAKKLADQGGTVASVYDDVALTTEYTSGGVAGTTVYCKVAEAVAEEFRAGHQVLLRKSTDSSGDTNGKVTNVILNGASSIISVKLLEAATASVDLDETNYILIIGNVNAEGATMPEGIQYDPVEYSNNTQIWRTPLSITRTARRTGLRTPDQYQEAKREALEYHGIEMEKTIIYGTKTSGIGSNGKPERTTGGIHYLIDQHNPTGIYTYNTDTDYTGLDWTATGGGEDWLDATLSNIFKWGKNVKMGIAGIGAVLAINKLIKAKGTYEFTPATLAYGIQAMRWVTPFGELYLKTHPLYSWQTATTNEILVLEPENLGFRYIDDTMFIADPEDKKNRNNSKDATEEEYLTEGGFEWDHAETFSRLKGVGVDNDLS